MPARSGYLLAAAAAAHLLPSVAAIRPLSVRLWPGLTGAVAAPHVALTFDDGPDGEAAPQLLDALDELGVRATFFVLGSSLQRWPQLGREAAARGHELAVHGWEHRPHLLRNPLAIGRDLERAVAAVEAAAGSRPRFWRPPHGILTGAALGAARRLGLRPVLWTADGRDWRADATGESVSERIIGQLEPGGVVLLHDSDVVAQPGTWRRALGALPRIVETCRARDWQVGPLGEHGLEVRGGRLADH